MKIDKSKKFSGYRFAAGDFFTAVEKPREIDLLVFHHVEAISVDHAISQFINHGVSCHFIINREGDIFQLVEENDIAFHAGVSSWRNVESLNKHSIGIELINIDPFSHKFSEEQMVSAVMLGKYLTAKYGIEARNVVGHSDIAYNKETRMLNRKQDPSHLFDWKFLGNNGVGLRIDVEKNDKIIFKFEDCNLEIKTIKENLDKFGYLVMNLNGEFDEEMRNLVRVFNRRFIAEETDLWRVDSAEALNCLMKRNL